MRSLFVVFVFMTVLLRRHSSDGQFDLLNVYGCQSTEFRLDCGDVLGARVVIFEAAFYKSTEGVTGNSTCESLGLALKESGCTRSCTLQRCQTVTKRSDDVTEVNFRHAINRRCSGVKHCSYTFEKDYTEGIKLGLGGVIVSYACVKDETIAKSCNANINVTGEGLARSPGYPSYYIGEIACKWSLRAPHSQKVRVRLLDVSLRGIAPYDADCVDWIDITENGLNLVKTCGDVLEDVVVHSQGSALNVSFIANSKTIYPKRGFLFHYKAVGCSTLRKPEDAYLIERNNSFVHYRCCSGFVFRDSLARDKILQCYNENTWDGELSECVSLTKLREEGVEVFGNETSHLTGEAREKMESMDPISDIILPSLVIGALLVGNIILIYIIYLQKKKLAQKEEHIKLQPITKGEVNNENI